MTEMYRSRRYAPELVTGRYVRVTGRRGSYLFCVYETESGILGPGMGATLREYVTDGAELPDDLRAKCIASKNTEKWD